MRQKGDRGMTISSIAQLITVLFIFILVLAATFYVTRWIARYQKVSGKVGNIELLETCRLSTNKYIQVVKVSSKYMVLAVCKDTVTVITELSQDEYQEPDPVSQELPDFSGEFAKVLERFKKK